MGAYLAMPITDKESSRGETREGYSYGISTMQGWRRTQEDAHMATSVSSAGGGASTVVFGVFDGHGGREVSAYAARHFAKLLSAQPCFDDDLSAALASV